MLLYTLEVSNLWFGILPLFVISHYHIYDEQQVYTVLFQIPKYICCTVLCGPSNRFFNYGLKGPFFTPKYQIPTSHFVLEPQGAPI